MFSVLAGAFVQLSLIWCVFPSDVAMGRKMHEATALALCSTRFAIVFGTGPRLEALDLYAVAGHEARGLPEATECIGAITDESGACLNGERYFSAVSIHHQDLALSGSNGDHRAFNDHGRPLDPESCAFCQQIVSLAIEKGEGVM